jgi:orotidine-5'-phosphate decarboxylase
LGEHFADRLLAAIDRTSPVCVGLDPVYEQLPSELRTAGADEDRRLAAVEAFCQGVLEVVAPIVPAVKLQSACFELFRDKGVKLYFELVQYARDLGLLVIGDVKRGDIGSSASVYAAGHLGHAMAPDAVTVNGYFGADGLLPFLQAARATGAGVFVLVRTSNPSAAAVQDFTDAAGRRFYEHLAAQLAELGAAKDLIGRRGYSCLGAVVGATYPAEARRLREIMPQQIFLVPGYGAQGATAGDCAAAFAADGTGAIVNASRSVIFAYNQPGGAKVRKVKKVKKVKKDWKQAVADAASTFAADIASAVRR